MHIYQSSPLYSAKDLLNFLGCHHSTALDLLVLQGDVAPPPDEADAYLDLLKNKGVDHERSFLEQRRAEGRSLCEVPRLDSIDAMAAARAEAMRQGVDVIYQGALVSHRGTATPTFYSASIRPRRSATTPTKSRTRNSHEGPNQSTSFSFACTRDSSRSPRS